MSETTGCLLVLIGLLGIVLVLVLVLFITLNRAGMPDLPRTDLEDRV